MMILVRFLSHSVFLLLYSIWLLVFLVFGIIGFLVPPARRALTVDLLDQFKTICGILRDKQVLSREQYEFESQKVAKMYDLATFHGYRWIVWPVTKTMSLTSHFDPLIMFFVGRWILVHRSRLDGDIRAPLLYRLLTKVATTLAQRVGLLLFCFRGNQY